MGVGGSGASAAFAIAQKTGYTVSGCDKSEDSPYIDSQLKKFVVAGHDPAHLQDIDLLIYSPAIPLLDPENSELRQAKDKYIKAVSWEQFVGEELLDNKFVIAVCGTHGKGTIASMIAKIMIDAGLDPTCLIGGVLIEWEKNWRVGKSKYFIVEADEYRDSFLNYKPDIAVISNIDFDHPEYFENLAKTRASFDKFVKNSKPGSILIEGVDVKLENPYGRTAVVSDPVKFDLALLGSFNKMNAALAFAVGRELLIDSKKITKSLEKFKGLKRRFELVGKEKGIWVFDDYAHHPKAIEETAKAARQKFPDKKITLVFEPHTFSRTKSLFYQFVEVFKSIPVDRVILLDIFAAREKDEGLVNSQDLSKAVNIEKVEYIPTAEKAADFLVKELKNEEVVLYMSAGNWQFPHILLSKLKNKD